MASRQDLDRSPDVEMFIDGQARAGTAQIVERRVRERKKDSQRRLLSEFSATAHGRRRLTRLHCISNFARAVTVCLTNFNGVLVMGVNKDQVKGRVNEVAGKVKETAGKIVGNEDLEAEGSVQKNIGVVQSTLGDVKEDIKKSIKGS
jgi:uncharacterized protein YjbJ (UPF0337 family)